MICSCGGLTRSYQYTTKDGVVRYVDKCVACGRRHMIEKKKQVQILRRIDDEKDS